MGDGDCGWQRKHLGQNGVDDGVNGATTPDAGLADFPEAKTFKIHSFRHTFLSQLARSKGSERYALDFLGHSSSDVTNLYFKRYDTEAERQISTIRYGLSPGAPDRKDAGASSAAPEAA